MIFTFIPQRQRAETAFSTAVTQRESTSVY